MICSKHGSQYQRNRQDSTEAYCTVCEIESLRAQLAAAEARSTGGTCRILSGECDCTLCKQDAKIAELTREVGELHSQLAAAERDLAEVKFLHENQCNNALTFMRERDEALAQLAAAEARCLEPTLFQKEIIIDRDEWKRKAISYAERLAAAEAALDRILHFATGDCKMGDATRLKCIAMECKATAARAAGQRDDLATAHGLLREAITTMEDEGWFEEHIDGNWAQRAKKEVGDD